MTRCAICRKPFTKRSMTHKTCGPDCAEKYGREIARQLAEKQKRKEAKAERLNDKERKEALKSKNDVAKEVERIVNAYIRERDKDLPCVSCGTFTSASWEAGHYVSVGANKTIRFEPENIHKQCHSCNHHKGGNAIPYRINLIKRIGLDRVEWLEGWHQPRHYTKDDLQEIKVSFREKLRELKNGI